jgi:predicted alpha-1,2-mannosidase
MPLKFIFFFLFVHALNQSDAQSSYNQFVNPFIGTGGHGHTYPGATLPHGMVQLSPDTRLNGWDGCGGYHYSDSFIYGFSHTHLSGTGVSDYGDILLMPMQGAPSPSNKIYGSAFSHYKESASPGYYAVQLLDDNIAAEFTATTRTGYHHYRFAGDKSNQLILDLQHRDEVLESSIHIEDGVTITGMRRSKSWATNQYVYFVMKLSSAPLKSGIWLNDTLIAEKISKVDAAKNIKAYFTFSGNNSKDLYVQVAISSVSIEGAKANLMAESHGKSFNEVRQAAAATWETELSKIDVKSKSNDDLSIFYTALYHTAIVPCLDMDVDQQYRGRDNLIHTAVGYQHYSVFSLWDTYRATHPLYTLIDRERTLHYIKTFLAQYKEGGRLPVWELASNETDCMIGYHSVSVIADAYLKGIGGFDSSLALEAMLKSANWKHLGLPTYISTGRINTEAEHESVSKTLEYSCDDYCIAAFAAAIGDSAVSRIFSGRAQYYKNILDTKTGFMRPVKNGGWQEPFDPSEVNNHFTEANSWQYSFYMPQDVDGYMKLMGGQKKFEDRLDVLFTAASQTTGRDQADITGLIGQYAHGNEPSHHIAYLYNHAGNPSKAQAMVRRILKEMYTNSPDGLIGNEDCGQMSAWYVLSSLGFYPVTPGSGEYIIGSPLFDLAEIRLENGKSFIINAPENSDENKYIQQALLSTTASLRPKEWNKPYLLHHDIAVGGLITFMMGNHPSNFFTGSIPGALESIGTAKPIVINPIIYGGGPSFKDSLLVELYSPQSGVTLFYTTDGSIPSIRSKRYTEPIKVKQSMILKAIAIDENGNRSFIAEASYQLMPHQWKVQLLQPYEKQYDGGGPDGLVDGILGTTNWRMGNWQGYQVVNPDIVIDLGKPASIKKIAIGLLQDTRSWIVMPSWIKISISTDGNSYKSIYFDSAFKDIRDEKPQRKWIETKIKSQSARYVRIEMKQYGKLPEWHEGAGGDTHIFVDEVTIE